MRSQFFVYTVFFLLPIFVSTFSVCTDRRIVYIYMYIYIYFSSCWANGPRHLIPLSPKPAHASSIFLSLLSVPSDRVLMVALYLHACNRYIRIHVVHVSPFRLLAQIKLRDDDSTHECVLWSRFSTRLIHVKQLMCCRSCSSFCLSITCFRLHLYSTMQSDGAYR